MDLVLVPQVIGTRPQSKIATIAAPNDHNLIRLADTLDWNELIGIAKKGRRAQGFSTMGRQPRYREMLGALVMMAIRKCDYRTAEDLIRFYIPARYLCNLMDSDQSLDHVSIHDFVRMIGANTLSEINAAVLRMAGTKGYLDPMKLMSDTTAQEARIPYPTEVGLMLRYSNIVKSKLKKVGKMFSGAKTMLKDVEAKIKGLVRNNHLFAKTREQKRKVTKKLFHVVEQLHEKILEGISIAPLAKTKAQQEISKIAEVMTHLLPQMKHFIDTGFVASKKIIHLQMPDLYSIVRGKAGKAVEFGLKWGINRVSGFLQGFLVNGGKHYSDQRFCRESVNVHQQTFGVVPRVFGFDRGGYSDANIRRLQKKGVKHVGVAPKGKTPWAVSKAMEERIRQERAQVEGCIGSIKSDRYGFNKPGAKSVASMETYGQRAILGFNLNKLLKMELLESSFVTN